MNAKELKNLVNNKSCGPGGEVNKGKKLYPKCDTSIWLRSCSQEVVQPLEGKLSGQVPKWLRGSLIRNGPGSLKVGDMTFEHLFDSSALLHRFAIADGSITYQSRFLQSEAYKQNHAANRIVFTEFGTKAVPDPCQTIFNRISAVFSPDETMSDNAMISVYPFGDELYTFTEIPVIHRIDPNTLETLERVNLSKHVNIVNHTSHPHVVNDGTVYNLGLSVTAMGPKYAIVKFPPPKNSSSGERTSAFQQARIVATLPPRWLLHPAYMHTFGLTDSFFVVVEQPLSVSVPKLLRSRLGSTPMAGTLEWYPEHETLIHLIERDSGKHFKTFSAEAFFYLHIINQYEKDGHVVLDICCYKDASMIDCMYVEAIKNLQSNPDYATMFRGRPMRYVLPLSEPPGPETPGRNLVTLKGSRCVATRPRAGEKVVVVPELICDVGCETPRIHYERHLGRPYRYFYAISSDVDFEHPGSLLKVDTETGTWKLWNEENVYPSEPIFVPAPDAQGEDDGVLLSALVWGGAEETRAGVLVLDARSLAEVARAEFLTPSAVPKCLHGWFVGDFQPHAV
ncbi:carotenoid isomerooxygenase isoform X2 [Bacillus rossius redtenbacheri]